VFPTLADFKKSYEGVTFETPRYGRSGTSTAFELQSAMASLCNTQSCIATSCGLSACAAVLGAYAKPGSHILIQNGVYGPTKALADTEIKNDNVSVQYFDSAQELTSLLQHNTRLIFLEVPSSLTMNMLNVKEICNIAQSKNIPVACDSTWGTPVFFDAHSLGINISIHAATKYIGGHSDTMLGLITGTYEDLKDTRNWCERYGSHAAPDTCWMVLRGLRTLSIRMERHQKSAIHIAKWLQKQPQIEKVFFPALPDDAGYSLWKEQFSGAAGPFTVQLTSCDESSYEEFINTLKLFGLGTSWGGFESLIMPAIAHHLRSAKQQPKEGRLVRLHIGLENADDLCDDLKNALALLSN
jgi:cystathionine beta-lyase